MKTMENIRRWLALLLVSVMVILTGCSGGKKQEKPAPAATTAATEAPVPTPEATEIPAATEAPAFVEDESLILYIKDNMLDVGGDGTLEVSVLCGDGVKDNIDVVDDAGTVLHTIENTSGGKRYEFSVEVPTETEHVGTLSARTDSAESTPRKFYVYPEVTEEMVARLDEAGANMLEYVASCDFEDRYSEEAFRQVADWLNQQDYIAEAKVNGGGVLFRTDDGLVGGYGYETQNDGYLSAGGRRVDSDEELGFSDPSETFEKWLVGDDLEDIFLKSDVVPTNNNYLVLASDMSDSTIYQLTEQADILIQILEEETNGDATTAIREEALSALESGDITDYGFLIFLAHGVEIYHADGTPYYTISLGDYSDEDFSEKVSQVSLLISKSLDDIRAFKPVLSSSLCITVDYFEYILGNKVFDNTIVILGNCMGMRDESMADLLLEHGASSVIGFEEEVNAVYLQACIYKVVMSLLISDENEKYGSVKDGITSAGGSDIFEFNPADYADNKFKDKYYKRSFDELSDEGLFPASETFLPYQFSAFLVGEFRGTKELLESEQEGQSIMIKTRPGGETASDHTIKGYGLSTGTVVNNAGEPIVDAEVRLYRWLNHDFILHEAEAEVSVQEGESPDNLPSVVKTDERGEFSIKNVPYGLYVAYAEKDGRYGFTPFFVQAPDNEVVVTIKDNPFIMTTGVQEYVNPKLSAQIARPSFSLKGNEFVDDLGGMMRPLFSDAVLAVDDMMATPIYDGRKHISVAGVRDVFVSDRHVSVRVGSYQEYSNSAHGMHYWDSYTYWLDTGLPVQLHEILDPGVEQASYRLRTLWRNAIYHKGITDEMLWQPLERTLEAALLGDFPCYWSFTSEGLNLQFPLYEAGPYAVGSMEVTLPYHRLVYVIAPEFLPNDPPDELTVENEPVSASVMPIIFGKDYKHRFQEANEAAIRDGLEPPHPVYGIETEGGHLIAVDGYAKDFRILFDPEAYSEPIMLFFASSIENALVWLPDLEDDTFEAVWEADGVTRSVSLKF